MEICFYILVYIVLASTVKLCCYFIKDSDIKENMFDLISTLIFLILLFDFVYLELLSTYVLHYLIAYSK